MYFSNHQRINAFVKSKITKLIKLNLFSWNIHRYYFFLDLYRELSSLRDFLMISEYEEILLSMINYAIWSRYAAIVPQSQIFILHSQFTLPFQQNIWSYFVAKLIYTQKSTSSSMIWKHLKVCLRKSTFLFFKGFWYAFPYSAVFETWNLVKSLSSCFCRKSYHFRRWVWAPQPFHFLKW